MRKYWKECFVLFLILILRISISVEASFEDIANISISPDGSAFTVQDEKANIEWYEKGTEVFTGIEGTLGECGVGEHVYTKYIDGIAPVGKWVVTWENARCIHGGYPEGNFIYGVSFGKTSCHKNYYSGWVSYCADCGDLLENSNIYMSRETAGKITHIDLSKAYYYKCPHCDNLEQGVHFNKHACKGISINRYFVRYHANLGSGYMEKSVHIVNNETFYEGQEVTPQTTLNLNTYTRKGYVFTGWNTMPDGSGTDYADGAEIFNLSMEQNASVILYAQWKKCESVLELDPAGGSYKGESAITKIEGEYNSVYQLELKDLAAPKGYTIHFDTQGGVAVADMVGSRTFEEWSCSQPFNGILKENAYTYLGPDGNIDRITAIYRHEPVLLPEAEREGYSFGGWYADKECTIPVGAAGDRFIPPKEVTLYAAWVELLLESEDNYSANQGKGAVNLEWVQRDELEKVYQVYQKTDGKEWERIQETEGEFQEFQVKKTVDFSGKEGFYIVPYSGFYSMTLSGAQGGNYGDYQGGKGGLAQAVFYLERGEKIFYTIGGQDGFNGGGQGKTYANGGGYSIITSENGEILLIAGGGGGASDCGDGNPGGSEAHVTDTRSGESGETGGGGGYHGGICGEPQLHNHIEDCLHTHIGTPTEYGGCYTKKAICGSTNIYKKEAWRSFYYGNVSDDGSHKFCERCGSDVCVGHVDIYYNYTCERCGTGGIGREYEIKAVCTALTVYEPECGLEGSYICGMTEGQVLSAEPGYGGSNYVNLAECIDYVQEAGVQTGNGTLTIVSRQTGILENNLLTGVVATDMAAPEAVDAASILKTAVGEEEIRVAFSKPTDNGTAYYHMVESYDKNTNVKLCSSNQTKNVLTSGVVGYYYVIDERSDTIVGQLNNFYAETGENPFLVVEVTDSIQYLHLAAVDKAGNISSTIHIPISFQEVIYWPLITEKLQIENGKQIFPAAEADTYYVRADDSTPFLLTLEGLLCGTAREKYQINMAEFRIQNLTNQSQAGQLAVMIPNRENIAAGSYAYPMSKLSKKLEGILGLQDAAYTLARRYNMCKGLSVEQKFTLSKHLDGQLFQVTPRVAAVGETDTIWSQEEADLQNSLYVIADGRGPDITGLEALENLENLELAEGESLKVDISAADAGSGLAEFYIEVRNLENDIVVRLTDYQHSGKIQLEISEKEEVFQGEFVIGVYAEDNVGNETATQNNLMLAGLSAYVERVLEPHTPIFKKGESGVLYVETVGYVERVEISFPSAFAAQGASLNRTFIYDVPAYLQTEEIPFIVPFLVPEGEMTIVVKAYKAGTELDAKPELVTIAVKGSILDELRTRLR